MNHSWRSFRQTNWTIWNAFQKLQAARHHYFTFSLECGALKHVLQRYAGEYYFHLYALAYSSLIFLPAFDHVVIGNAGFVNAVRSIETHELYFDTVRLFFRSISIQHCLLIVFNHVTLNIVQ